MFKYSLALIFACFLLTGGNAYACRTDIRNSPDVTRFHNDASHQDLSDYGVIFDEAGNPSCAQYAANALYKKLYHHYHPNIDGFPQWPMYDGQTGTWVNPFQGWLHGAEASLVFAAALRLGGQGKLNKPLANMVDGIQYRMNVDHCCGFDGTIPTGCVSGSPGDPRWSTLNSCMEDYAIGASAYGWRALYVQMRNIYSAWWDAQNARYAIGSALNTTESVCVWVPSQHPNNPESNPTSFGPCTGNVTHLRDRTGVALALHAGDSIPYGAGLVTSIGSAAAALSRTSWPVSLSPDEQDVAQALLRNARTHTYSDGSDFLSDCYRFLWNSTNGAMSWTTDSFCGDGNTRYYPKMFPVKNFYDNYAPPDTTPYDFHEFQSLYFCDNFGFNYAPIGIGLQCSFYHPGRREIYGTLGGDWVKPANFPNNLSGSLGDYTVSFLSYYWYYLSAVNGGGGAVNAVPTTISDNERFSLVDLNGGYLMDGDPVTLQSLPDAHWITATGGGGPGSVARADSLYPLDEETFTIRKMNGTGSINNGDSVALQSKNSYYVCAEGGGNGDVTVNRVNAAQWETFIIWITHN